MKNIKMFGKIYALFGVFLFLSFLGGFLFEFYTNEDFVDKLQMKNSKQKMQMNETFLVNKTDEGVRYYDKELENLRNVSQYLLWLGIIIWAINIRHDFYDLFSWINEKLK